MQYDTLIQPDNGQAATLIHVTDKSRFEAWLALQPDAVRTAVKAQKFEGGANDIAILPADKTGEWSVAAGVTDVSASGLWHLAKLADSLPEGTYRLADYDASEAMLGWMLGQYRYHEYLSEPKLTGPRVLLVKEPARIAMAALQAAATALVRDLVNRPAGDLGPNALEAEAKRIAKAHKAEVTVTAGEPLEAGYPLIHAVGNAAAREHAPRLIELEWGDPRHPRVAIVGKGITFDTGGLDIKPSTGMRLMKKDMGGAAHALALAELIMAAHLPVRLHMLVAAAENSISGNAMRPGDIIKSRKGITVEIDNTDAEGRLVLADALTKAIEDKAELIIDFATLTGAARVALGPDLPAMFSNDDSVAIGLLAASKAATDPLWHMPLWAPYMEMLDSDIADTSNSGGGFAGAVTAALFLQKFVPDNVPWVHLDTFAWRPTSKPGRPKGGEALGLRAVFGYLAETYPAR
ncbi:MAG: leucyl aminopeptidase family protein [Sphingorhabdus sp.]|jgi:leucyl aminopeptidase|uniref:leucyl aminopeptidase family protein n=1 Tax=Sphingorhabdus sp. TaxID=1902408 RepID=UPI00273F46EC|nr:leucyl aminopeptidase family protein [Sphingorhabdus sp.]MDP4757048.1 leucyl aminopeptidase family protein [Sphingorhabdus sp.]MDP4872238.1 leucyl aminopeptidase family protein [Sphingorhabdus sp.]MDP4925979.1 leucyl aminopeptidase family protein [Sphingorhabdus sp.]